MELFEVALVVFAAALVRGVFGFGDSIVAMPILAFVLGLRTAAPLIGLTSVVFAVVMLLGRHRSIDIKATVKLLPWIAMGIPLGIVALVKAPQEPVQIALGIALVVYGLYSLIGPRLPEISGDWWAAPFGLLSGGLGGAFNINGPPIVVYGSLRRWSPEVFRATLQANFLITNAAIATGHGVGGLWTKAVFGYFALAVPVLLVGLLIGSRLAKSIHPDRFTAYLMGVVVILGISMVVGGLTG